MVSYSKWMAPAVALAFGLATSLTAVPVSAADISKPDVQKAEKPDKPEKPEKPHH